ETLQPRVGRAVVVQTEIGPIPWQRTGQGESRRRKLSRDPESFNVGANLEFSPRQPSTVGGECQSAKIPVAKNRRVQNINRFVVETFENCTRKVCVRIDDQRNCAPIWLAIRKRWGARWRGRPKYQAGKIGFNNELRAQGRDERSQINVPPIRAQRKPLEPLWAVNDPVRPFIGYFWLYHRISANPFFDLIRGQS